MTQGKTFVGELTQDITVQHDVTDASRVCIHTSDFSFVYLDKQGALEMVQHLLAIALELEDA